jgi:CBS domain-containing protein
MVKNNIGALLIVENEKLLGVFTERDVLKKVANKELNVKETPVKEVMTANVLTVAPHTTVAEAMAVITQKRFRHLPVVENDRLVGLISIGDLTRWVSRNQEIMIRDLENYITGEHHAPHHES